ncbi:MAG: phosphoribosylanthranilate isomerase [Roseivirga sp.]|jgi:phosphoribosylanthranilate isomerase
MSMHVKICGMREPENAEMISQLRPDLMGFILYPPSPRFVEEQSLNELLSKVSSGISTVAVFVNETTDEVLRICKKYTFAYAQLHGNEPAADCQIICEAGIKVIKAFSVSDAIDFEALKAYEPYVDLFLFDTKTSGYGGSGKQFDWSLLAPYPFSTPYFLSGGIGDSDMEGIKQSDLPGLAGIDANSRLEIEPGLKNVQATSKLINLIRKS